MSSRCELQYADADNDNFTELVDCNDGNAGIHPDAPEVCNGVDDDCNGAVDEGVSNSCGECGPDPLEVCDLTDNDCDGDVDEDCLGGILEETEPNDGDASCQSIPLPVVVGDTVTVTGTFDPAGDVDAFCLRAIAGQSAIFAVDSALLGAPTDAKFALIERTGGLLLAEAEDGFAQGRGYDPYLEYDFLADRDVRIEVRNVGGTGGTDHIYSMWIEATNPPGACSDGDGDQLSACDGDCDDTDPLVFPGQQEVCDRTDNNCDGVLDEGCPIDAFFEIEPNGAIAGCMLVPIPGDVAGAIDPQLDQDTFCFFVPRDTSVAFDIDAREPPMLSPLDAKITLLELSGEAIESNDDGTDPQTGYFEPQSDSFLAHTYWAAGTYAVRVASAQPGVGSPQHGYVLRLRFSSLVSCPDVDGDGVTPCEGDCNDADRTVFFGAAELCDGRDNNCDNVSDPAECTGDWDGDGFSGRAGDCDDANPTVRPGAPEACDGFDNNCNGSVDEGVLNACGACGYPPPELCGNSIDDDCDGETDTDCSSDADSDGVTPDQGDCNDTRGDVFPAAGANPAAPELCDGVDNDCDGMIDEFVKNNCGTCSPPKGSLIELCDGIDNNCNGLVDDGALNACGYCGPAPLEICDGLDNNCNAVIDDGLTNACGECGPLPIEACDGIDNDCDDLIDTGCDVDGDGDTLTPRAGDCNDSVATTYWGAPDECDGIDNDCNGWVDDDYGRCPKPAESEPNNTAGRVRRPGVARARQRRHRRPRRSRSLLLHGAGGHPPRSRHRRP